MRLLLIYSFKFRPAFASHGSMHTILAYVLDLDTVKNGQNLPPDVTSIERCRPNAQTHTQQTDCITRPLKQSVIIVSHL